MTPKERYLAIFKFWKYEIKILIIKIIFKIIGAAAAAANLLFEFKIPEKKEVVKIDNDLEETSTLVNFFQDIKQIVEDKGIKVEENKDNFTLFDDASEV